MANEDIIKKDLVNELKDMEEENDQKHLEPVNVIIGRFQPLTIGHLGMAKELEKINGLPSVYIYIRSKSGDNSKFSDRLTSNYMEDVVKGENLVRDAWSMSASFIPVIIKETQRRGYNPVLIGAGEDRFKAYSQMAKKMKDIKTHPDFKIQELKGRLTSATEVRQAILDDDKKKFMKLVPKEVQPYYKHLKDELEKSHAVAESLTIQDIVEKFDYEIDVMESILNSYGEDFFSDTLIIESILNNDINEKLNNNMELIKEGTIDNAYKYITKVIKNKVSKASNDQYNFAKKYVQSEYGKEVSIEGIGVDNNKIYLSLNSADNDAIQIDIELPKELQESEQILEIKENYQVYHNSFGSVIKTILEYISESDVKIDRQIINEQFISCISSPNNGETIRKTIEDKGNSINIQVYNRATNKDSFELTIYHNKIRRGLKESINEDSNNKIFESELQKITTKDELTKLIQECFGSIGIKVYENVIKIHQDAVNKSHTRIFDRAIKFRKGELTNESLENKETDVIRFLSKLDESKLEHFKNYLTEMMSRSEYEVKLDSAITMIIKTNRPVVWEDFKSCMIRSEFFKKDFKPFLMMQGLSDFQIDRFIENILRVKYQHYTNYFLGTVPLQYITK